MGLSVAPLSSHEHGHVAKWERFDAILIQKSYYRRCDICSWPGSCVSLKKCLRTLSNTVNKPDSMDSYRIILQKPKISSSNQTWMCYLI